MTKSFLISVAAFLVCFTAEASDFVVTDYGVRADSMDVQTKGIQTAIDDCASKGGGRVVVPAGKYLTGEIILRSNVEFYLDAGAVLLGSRNLSADYPMQPRNVFRSLKDTKGWNALIFAADAKNISVTGQGMIDGRGRGARGWLQDVAGDANGRPKNILFVSCSNVCIENISMCNSAMWNIHLLNCDNVRVRGLNIYNHCNGNNDGIDIDCCRRVTIADCIIDSDDDGIVLKATGKGDCRDITISNCIVSSYANAIKLGTETTGDFRNICVTGCVITPSRSKDDRILKSTPSGITALSIEMTDGGTVDGVSINNVVIRGTECPLYVRLANRARKHIPEATEPSIGAMRNIFISNVTAYETGNFCSSITGIDSAHIQNVCLSNVRFENKGNLKWGDYIAESKDVVADEKGYPQPTVWGNLPARGLFIRNVDGITLSNVSFSSIANDPREAIITDKVTGFVIHN